MKTLMLRILMAAAIVSVFSFAGFGQTCERDYRRCVRGCNTTRDQTLSRNNLQRSQIRIQLAQDLIQCNVQFGDPAGREACRREKRAAADTALAALARSDRQAERDRITCITECRRRLRDCQQPPGPQPQPIVSGGFEIDCLEGGAPCRGAVSDFCQRAAGACDDCWRSLCGGGEWLIDSEAPLRSVALVAVSDNSRRERVLAISSINGTRARLNVPRDLKLRPGEKLYFQFSSRTKPHGPVKVTIHRDKY
jgi:hypothetical protein